MQPAVLERGGGFLRALPVALHQRRAAHAQLAFAAQWQQRAAGKVADLELGAGHRQADEGRCAGEVEVVVLQAPGEGVAGVGFGHAEAELEQPAAAQRLPACAVVAGQFLDKGDAAGALQRAQVVVAHVGVVQHLGGAVDQQAAMADLVMLHGGHKGQGIPARQQHQTATGEDREQQAGVFPGNPELGQEVQQHAVAVQAQGRRHEAGAGVEHVAVAVHAALGQAGGAAGVVQRGEVIQLRAMTWHGGGAGGQGRVEIEAVVSADFRRQQQVGHRDARRRWAQLRQAAGQHMAQRAVVAHRAYHRQQLVKTEEHLGAAVLELVAQFQGLAQRADRRIHRAALEDGVEGDMQLRAIGHKHRHPIAGTHAQFGQQRGAAVGLLVQLGVAQAVAVEIQRHAVRLQACPGPQVFAQGLLAVGVGGAARDGGGPGCRLQGGQLVEVGDWVHGDDSVVFIRRAS